MTDEDNYIVAMLHLWREKTFMHTARSFRQVHVIGLSLSFVLFQNGKKSLKCDLTVLGSFLSADMI